MYEDINTRKILTCFNPKIVETSKEEISIDEMFIILYLMTQKTDYNQS